MLKILVNFFYRNRVLTEKELREAVERLNKAWHTPRDSVKIIIPKNINLEDTVVTYYGFNEDGYLNEDLFFEKIHHKRKLRKYPEYHHSHSHALSERIRREWSHRYNYDPSLEKSFRKLRYNLV